MLKDIFYSIVSFSYHDKDKATAVIKLNGESDIFTGHFPGNPIVPGVCSIQIIKEMAERIAGRELKLIRGENIKFVGIINPDKTPEVFADIALKYADKEELMVNAVISGNGNPFVKFTGYFS